MAFWDAWDNSTARKTILTNLEMDRGLKDYLREPEEVFARAYSQWISKFDSTLGGQMAATRSNLPGFQWDDDDFGPIGDAVESIMRSYGLIL